MKKQSVLSQKYYELSLKEYPKGSICQFANGDYGILKDPLTGLTDPGGVHQDDGTSKFDNCLDIIYIQKMPKKGSNLWAYYMILMKKEVVHKNYAFQFQYDESLIQENRKYWKDNKQEWVNNKNKSGWLLLSEYLKQYEKMLNSLKEGDFVFTNYISNNSCIKRIISITSNEIILDDNTSFQKKSGINLNSFKYKENVLGGKFSPERILKKLNLKNFTIAITLTGTCEPEEDQNLDYFCLKIENEKIKIPYSILKNNKTKFNIVDEQIYYKMDNQNGINWIKSTIQLKRKHI